MLAMNLSAIRQYNLNFLLNHIRHSIAKILRRDRLVDIRRIGNKDLLLLTSLYDDWLRKERTTRVRR